MFEAWTHVHIQYINKIPCLKTKTPCHGDILIFLEEKDYGSTGWFCESERTMLQVFKEMLGNGIF